MTEFQKEKHNHEHPREKCLHHNPVGTNKLYIAKEQYKVKHRKIFKIP